MNKSINNPYDHTLLIDSMTLTMYYDNLLMLDWFYHLIDDVNLRYKKESELYAWYQFALRQSNPRYLQHFNMLSNEMKQKEITIK